jgi:hypothetical protein
MVSLDVQGAFDAAWWPSILSNLRDLRCSNNLYILTQTYFSDRVAVYYANTYNAERKVSMGCPQAFRHIHEYYSPQNISTIKYLPLAARYN